MKKIIAALIASMALMPVYTSCAKGPADVPDWRKYQKDNGKEEPASGEKIPSDMVLLYGYGHHRTPYKWSGSYLKDYVMYTDRSGKGHWLFDGFLLLEFMDSNGPGGDKTFITGYKQNNVALPSATKEDWQALINYYYEVDGGINAIEQAVAAAAEEMGEAPATKRKIVIGIPEPITNAVFDNPATSTKYWGSLAGREMDFSSTADRLAACKWYIDELVKKFNAGKYKYVDLVGFYWVAEKATHTRDLMARIGEYLDGKDYTFNWIPYFTADGFSEWKSFGFSCAYLQPNYFFNVNIPITRLDEACSQALKFGMGMEIEFDGNALEKNGRGYKLTDYMNKFKEYGVWKSLPIAYYQGSWALKWLKGSASEADKNLYHDFCEFVITRPYRTEKGDK